MKKTMSIILSLALVWVFAIVPASAAPASAAPTAAVNYAALTPNEKLVCDYWNSINTGNWNAWVSYYTPSVRSLYSNFVNNSANLSNNVGILTVDSAKVVSVERVDNRYAPRLHELTSYLKSENGYQVYLVGVNMGVKQNTEYFYNGVNYKLVTLVNDNGTWAIGATSGAPIEALLASNGQSVDEAINAYSLRVFGNSVSAYGVGWGLLSPGSTPTSIKVANADGSRVYNVNFNSFIQNVTQNEVGNMGFNANAVKAQAIAAKMAGWWAKVAQYRDDIGADIQEGDVTYIDGTVVNQSVKSACSAVSRYKMVSNSSSGGKLFYAAYFAGDEDDSGQGSGELRQYGADYLANTYHYDWKQILHYYYDNSSYNNPDVGIVQIR